MKCVLSKVYVGHSQDMRQFNIVEGGHSVIGVCNIFGSFIRFQVTEDRDDGECWVIEHARDSNGIHNFPPSVTEKTRKDMLYNVIVQFCIRNNYSWEDPATYGKMFITDLCNTLWYIDGHSPP